MKNDVQNSKFLGEIIAVSTQKGGVGKTTVVINLGVALSMKGFRVLCVDSDKQINMTTGLIKSPEKIKNKNLGVIHQNILNGITFHTKNFITHTRYLDIIAGNRSLYKYKKEFDKRDDRNTIYRSILEELRYSYDFILIDCPPTAGIENVQAYTAATKVLIVSEPSLYSYDGIINAVEIARATKEKTNKELGILGIVINKMNLNWNDHEEYEKDIRESFSKYVHFFDTVIPYRVSVARSTSLGKSVLQHRSKDKASLAFERLALEVAQEVM